MAKGLTQRQREVLGAFVEFQVDRGISPTYRELGEILGVTLNAVNDNLKALRRKGYINHRPEAARGHTLPVAVPLAGEAEPAREPPHQERYHATIGVTRTEDGGMVLVIQRTPQQLDLVEREAGPE